MNARWEESGESTWSFVYSDVYTCKQCFIIGIFLIDDVWYVDLLLGKEQVCLSPPYSDIEAIKKWAVETAIEYVNERQIEIEEEKYQNENHLIQLRSVQNEA